MNHRTRVVRVRSQSPDRQSISSNDGQAIANIHQKNRTPCRAGLESYGVATVGSGKKKPSYNIVVYNGSIACKIDIEFYMTSNNSFGELFHRQSLL